MTNALHTEEAKCDKWAHGQLLCADGQWSFSRIQNIIRIWQCADVLDNTEIPRIHFTMDARDAASRRLL